MLSYFFWSLFLYINLATNCHSIMWANRLLKVEGILEKRFCFHQSVPCYQCYIEANTFSIQEAPTNGSQLSKVLGVI